MNKKTKLKDLVIVLPGISGSVLEKDGKEVWGFSARSIFKTIFSKGKSWKDLSISSDDGFNSDFEDGVRATKIIQDTVIIPRFVKIDGYTGITKQLMNQFQILKGDIETKKPANFFEFPYDWRLDNRVTAQKLSDFIDERLKIWREYSGVGDAKVILIGHSMGGLISRYYTEVLEGWKKCKLLITIATPHRGSVKMIDFLANGYKEMFIDLTNLLRSFPSTYQLISRYPVIDVNGSYKKINDIAYSGLEKNKVNKGLDFFYELDKAVERNSRDEKYFNNYKLVPIVGIGHKTFQSFNLSENILTPSYIPPGDMPSELGDGDGSVPRVSAIPIKYSNEMTNIFHCAAHSSIQNSSWVLDYLSELLKHSQFDLSSFRGGETVQRSQSVLSIDVEEAYDHRDSITIKSTFFGNDSQLDPEYLKGKIFPLSNNEKPIEVTLNKMGKYYLGVAKLNIGVYRIKLDDTFNRIKSGSDIFLVY